MRNMVSATRAATRRPKGDTRWYLQRAVAVAADQMCVEFIAHLGQLALRHLLVQVEQLLLDHAFLEHQDKQHLGPVDMD